MGLQMYKPHPESVYNIIWLLCAHFVFQLLFSAELTWLFNDANARLVHSEKPNRWYTIVMIIYSRIIIIVYLPENWGEV